MALPEPPAWSWIRAHLTEISQFNQHPFLTSSHQYLNSGFLLILFPYSPYQYHLSAPRCSCSSRTRSFPLHDSACTPLHFLSDKSPFPSNKSHLVLAFSLLSLGFLELVFSKAYLNSHSHLHSKPRCRYIPFQRLSLTTIFLLYCSYQKVFYLKSVERKKK